MHTRLASRFPDIHSNVVAVGRMLFLDRLLNLGQQRKNSGLFFSSHFEKACYMTLGNNEYVPAAK